MRFKTRKTVLIISAIAVVILAGVASILVVNNLKKDSTQKLSFSFDANKAPNWWAGSNYWPDPREYDGTQTNVDELPTLSRVINSGTEQAPGDCFVSYSLYQGKVDIAAKIKENEGRTTANQASYSLDPINTTTLTIETPEGVKDYELHQYDLQVPPGTQLSTGIQFAFVPLSNSYIELRGYCATADLLEMTIPALSAVSLSR